MIPGVEIENRDAIVLSHAVRLEILESITKDRGQNGLFVVSVIVSDGNRLRLFISITGAPDEDNGLLMLTAPNALEYEAVLKAVQISNYAGNPVSEKVIHPCRN